MRDIHDAEFLISLRHGWLPLRTGDRVILEAYNPHWYAHQFGYDLVIPAPKPSCKLLSPDIMIIGNCWSSLLRTGTGSTFVIPRAKRPIQFSATYQRWFHAAFEAYSKEILALLLAIEKWRHFFEEGGKLVIRTDHRSLRHLSDKKFFHPLQPGVN